MIADDVSPLEHVSIRLIPESEWNVPRCGTCFAHMGDSCAKDDRIVTDFTPACENYDPDDLK